MEDNIPEQSSEDSIDHSNLVLKSLESLHLNDEFSDLTLIVEGEEIPAHRMILASSSDYFRALLYGGLQESQTNRINLKCQHLELFKKLLKYVYTGKINLTDLPVDEILIIFQMSHEYNFRALYETVSKNLISILNLQNVCCFFDLANFYEINELKSACLHYLDHNAEQILEQDGFLRLSKMNLKSILLRESFCTDELNILIALNKWIEANPDEKGTKLYAQIRMNLIDLERLIELIRPSELSADQVLDLIYLTVKNKEKNNRCFTLPGQNLVCRAYGTKVLNMIDGELDTMDLDNSSAYLRDAVASTSPKNANYLETEEVPEESNKKAEQTKMMSNLIKPNEDSCILVEFKYPYRINMIKMLLYHKDDRFYSYYVEISLDAKNWERVIDHTAYICRSGQFLYFEPRVVRYVKVVGTSCDISDHFQVSAIECLFTEDKFELSKGLIKPKSNVATLEKSAQVIEGVSRIKDVLLFGDDFKSDPDVFFTCHQINNGSITIQLSQPYMISTIRFLLYDLDKRKYNYDVFVSTNKTNWTKVTTQRNCRSWQIIRLDEPLPVVFVKLTGTYCSINQAFHLVRFECF